MRMDQDDTRTEEAIETTKYIRTYAGDMATVQKGGRPDLAPFGGQAVSLQAEPGEVIRTFYEDAEKAKKTSAEVPQETQSAREETLARLRERAEHFTLMPKSEAPLPPLAPSPPLPTFPPPGNLPSGLPVGQYPSEPPVVMPSPSPFSPPQSLHTYEEDVTRQIKTTGATSASILAAQADVERPPAPLPAPAPFFTGTRKTLIAGALILIAVGGLYYAYARYAARVGPVAVLPVVSAPIFVDDRETVSGAGSALMLALAQAVGRPLGSGKMRLLYDPSATTTSLFNELDLSAPDILLRNINADGSMAGVANVGGSQSLFFILSVASYGDTFAGMLSWEGPPGGPSVLRNLAKFYPPYPPAPASATSTATTTPRAAASSQGFLDQVIANHDTRIYRDAFGRAILVYGYWNQKTLIIARDEDAFAAIINRLATSKSK